MLSLRQSPSGTQLIVVRAHSPASPTACAVNLCLGSGSRARWSCGEQPNLVCQVFGTEFTPCHQRGDLETAELWGGLKLAGFMAQFSSSSSTAGSGLLCSLRKGDVRSFYPVPRGLSVLFHRSVGVKPTEAGQDFLSENALLLQF